MTTVGSVVAAFHPCGAAGACAATISCYTVRTEKCNQFFVHSPYRIRSMATIVVRASCMHIARRRHKGLQLAARHVSQSPKSKKLKTNCSVNVAESTVGIHNPSKDSSDAVHEPKARRTARHRCSRHVDFSHQPGCKRSRTRSSQVEGAPLR